MSHRCLMGSIRPAAAGFDARRRLMLALLCSAQFLVVLDFSIVNVALPSIQADLGFSRSELQWLITAFLLPFGGLLLLAGRAADLFGRRRLFLAGMGLFTVASLLGGLAQSEAWLLAARAGQGLGAALVAPAALSLLTTSFAEGPERERALGVNGAVLSGGFVAGVILGGILTGALSWRWTLFVNVPVGVAAMLATPALLPESRDRRAPQRLDAAGALLGTASLTSLIYGISTAEGNGWLAGGTILTVGGGLALGAAFLLVESRAQAPLAPLAVLRRRSVLWGNAIGMFTFGVAVGATFTLTLYMQEVLGFSPLGTGLAFAALGVAAVVAGAVGPSLTARAGVRAVLTAGLVIQAAGTAGLILIGAEQGLAVILVATAVLGFGHVLAVVSFTIIATSGLPDHQQGLAGGLVQTAQQVGAGLGLAVIVAIATARSDALRGSRPEAEVLVGGAELGLLAGAAALALAALLCRRLIAG